MAKVSFNVDAYTARLIGRENVSKLDGAIIELIKNTYDADASVCVLYYDDISDVLYIADNGEGMTKEILLKHWMTIGRSSKKEVYTTHSGRVQTGAKGIGRFALDRISDHCTMLTKTADAVSGILWNVDWSEFSNNLNITDITADVDPTDMSFVDFFSGCSNDKVIHLVQTKWSNRGTIFKLTFLRENWNKKLLQSIRENLLSLIPYELGEVYKIYCFDNETSIDEAEVFSDIDAFSYDYKIDFSVGNDGDLQEVAYRIWRDEYAFGSGEDKVLQETGLLDEKRYFHGEPIARKCSFADIVADNSNTIGKFNGVFYFSKVSTTSQDRERFFQKDISGRVDVRDTFGGVKIYRDSFRVRPYGDPKSSAYDWLQLARRKTASSAGVGSKGVWRVRADQVVGSVFISRINIALPDQSNREGIVETKEFRLLKEFMIKIIELLEQDRQYVCRKLNAYYQATHPTEEIEKEIREKAEAQKNRSEFSFVSKEKTVGDEKPRYSNVDIASTEAQKVIDAKDEQIEELQNELKMLRALATTGIVTNTYIHEFKTLTHKLNMKIIMAKEAIDYYNDIKEASEYIDEANIIREAFNSWFQVTIDSIKNDKRKRRKIDVLKVVDNLVASWNQTLGSKSIHIQCDHAPYDEIVLRCFPYEIETIINNLITNSVASFDSIRTDKREILIQISEDQEFVYLGYSDTGAGLSPIYRRNPSKILNAFETSKRDESGELVGTGMGMWIVNNIVLEYRGKLDLGKNVGTNKGFYVNISLKK